jgi:hypothetical protein
MRPVTILTAESKAGEDVGVGRLAGGGRGGQGEDESAGQGEAGRHPRGKAQEQRHDEAPLADVVRPGRELGDARDLGQHDQGRHHQDPGAGRQPHAGIAGQPRGTPDAVAGGLDGRLQGRRRDRAGADDLDTAVHRRGGDTLDIRKPPDFALDPPLTRTTGHPDDGEDLHGGPGGCHGLGTLGRTGHDPILRSR